jgi:hypothetical protein
VVHELNGALRPVGFKLEAMVSVALCHLGLAGAKGNDRECYSGSEKESNQGEAEEKDQDDWASWVVNSRIKQINKHLRGRAPLGSPGSVGSHNSSH